jgi:pimeloyl-ACP methyl ester carboxylesterase
LPQARVNGVQLFYEMTGSGPGLVLVHGSWGDHANWAAVAPALAESFRVVTYDRRGHSRSERLPGQGSVHEDVADVAALIEHLDLAPAHVAANSFGAAIALRLAARRPDLLRSLIAHEPPLIGLLAEDAVSQPMLAEIQRRIAVVVERLESGDHAGGAQLFVETVALGPGAWENQLTPEMREIFIANAPTWLDETHDPDALLLDLPKLAAFRRPTLLTEGDASPPFFTRVLDLVAAALPTPERATLQGAGHVPHLSHPAAYVESVVAFTRRAGTVESGK